MGRILACALVAVTVAFGQADSKVLKELSWVASSMKMLDELHAEFDIEVYNAATSRIELDRFGIWLNRSERTVTQLAISSAHYGSTYIVGPAEALWWDDEGPTSLRNPSNPLDIRADWMGPFGDSFVGQAMFSSTFSPASLWKNEQVLSVSETDDCLSFAVDTGNDQVRQVTIPLTRYVVKTPNRTVTIDIGHSPRMILSVIVSKQGRPTYRESWLPISWRFQ